MGADVGIRDGLRAMWWTVDWGKETYGFSWATRSILAGVRMKLFMWRGTAGPGAEDVDYGGSSC